jgi:peptidoglycan hydrolase CwlO-like protein
LGVVILTARATGQPAEVDPGPIAMTLPELEDELRRRQQDLDRYGERLDGLEQQNDEVRRELEARGEVLRRQESEVRARLITLCRLSRGGYLQMLGGSRSWADLFRRSQFARSLVDQELEALGAHQSEVEELDRRYRQLDRRLNEQRQLQERIVQYQRELEAERERRLNERARAASDPYRLGTDFDFDSLNHL